MRYNRNVTVVKVLARKEKVCTTQGGLVTNPIRADKIKPEKVDWLWKGRIPRGMMSIVAGRPDQGKGLFMSHLAAEVSRTRIMLPDGSHRWGQVLYSAAEDAHALMTVPRLQASGAVMKNVYLDRFRLPEGQMELEAFIIEKNIDLVVLDPIAAHLGRGVSRHSDNIRTVLNPLSEFIEESRTAVVMVEHVLKRFGKNAHPLAAIGGSGSGLPAAARMAFILGVDPDDDDRRILACVKSNIRDAPKAVAFQVDSTDLDEIGDVPYLLLEDEEVDYDPLRLLVIETSGRTGRPPDKRAAAAEWLTNYLYAAGQPVPAGKVIEDSKHYSMTVQTLRRAAADLGVLRNPPGGGRNCTWELPEELKQLMDEANGVAVETEDGVIAESLLSDEDFDMLLGGGELGEGSDG